MSYPRNLNPFSETYESKSTQTSQPITKTTIMMRPKCPFDEPPPTDIGSVWVNSLYEGKEITQKQYDKMPVHLKFCFNLENLGCQSEPIYVITKKPSEDAIRQRTLKLKKWVLSLPSRSEISSTKYETLPPELRKCFFKSEIGGYNSDDFVAIKY